MYEYIGILLGARPFLHISRIKVNTIDSPYDEHRGARNMERIGININEKKVLFFKLVIYKNC
jgi:hypothetical protein